MVASIDGRTLLDRWRPQNVVPEGLFERVYQGLEADAWLIGRATGQEYAKGQAYQTQREERFSREAWFARRDAKGYGIVLDPKGKIAWGMSDIEGDHIVVVLSEQVSDAHLAGLRADAVSYIFAGKTSLDLSEVLETLGHELGVKRLLLQGGGVTNGAFLRAGLVDEISMIIFPTVDGAKGAPSVFDSSEDDAGKLAPVRSIMLESHQILEGGAVWLRYTAR